MTLLRRTLTGIALAALAAPTLAALNIFATVPECGVRSPRSWEATR